MIDLVKEIKKLKEEYNWTNLHRREHVDIKNDNIDLVLEILNQYNIITAPKEIKLSEIIERLRIEQNDYDFRYKDSSISVWKNKWCYAVAYIDDDTLKLDFDIHDRYLFPKWIFSLWIAGTTIIDDLEE